MPLDREKSSQRVFVGLNTALVLLVVVVLGGFLINRLRAPFDLDTYRRAIKKASLVSVLKEAEQLVSEKRVKRDLSSGGFDWQDISKAPPAILSLPHVTAFSVQEESVLLLIPDLDLCFLEICSSSFTGSLMENDDGVQRTRRVAERVYLFEAWYRW